MMFPLSPLMWVYAGVGVLVLALGAGVKIQTSRLDACKAGFEAFRGGVAALGREAEKAAKKAESDNLKAKEAADAKTKVLLADNATLGKRLRDARASSGYVPPAAPNSPSPDRACFDRAELERSLQRFDDGAAGLISEGDAAKLKLSSAAEWAASVGAR